MKLVIDIPEEEYELIVNDEACGLNLLTRAIAKGALFNDVVDKIKSEVLTISQIDSDGHNNNWYREPQAIINDVLKIIGGYATDKIEAKKIKD